MPSALVFDAYGTLFDVHSVAARCESRWPDKGAALAQLWRARQLEYTWQRSLMRRYAPFSQVTRDALVYSCEFLKLKLEKKDEETLMDEYRRLECFADVRAALQKFQGMKLAILTNGSPDMIEPLVAHSGLKFDALLSVDAVKVFKPAPEAYQLAVDRLGVAKADIGFVSSNCWDAIGARAFGFRVSWINRTGAPADRLGFAPDQVAKGLDEVLL